MCVFPAPAFSYSASCCSTPSPLAIVVGAFGVDIECSSRPNKRILSGDWGTGDGVSCHPHPSSASPDSFSLAGGGRALLALQAVPQNAACLSSARTAASSQLHRLEHLCRQKAGERSGGQRLRLSSSVRCLVEFLRFVSCDRSQRPLEPKAVWKSKRNGSSSGSGK